MQFSAGLARTHKENMLAEFSQKLHVVNTILVRSFLYVKSFLSTTIVCNASALSAADGLTAVITMVTSDALGVAFLYDEFRVGLQATNVNKCTCINRSGRTWMFRSFRSVI